MIEVIEQVLARWFDAIVRGAAWGISVSVAWCLIFPAVKYTPRLLKALGVW